MSRVLIVNMPFSNLRWPSLGPSLLRAALAERGLACDLAYLNFDFAERIGLDRYTWIADCFAFVLGGERLFAKGFVRSGTQTVGWDCAPLVPPYGGLPDDDEYYRDVLLAADPGLSNADFQDFQSAAEHVEPFLEACLRSIDWPRYKAVGFTASFQQTMPSLCLAQRIKALRPETEIILGGAACEGPMGVELLRQFPFVDYVCLGEADLTFPPLVEEIIAGRPVRVLPGMAVQNPRVATRGFEDCPAASVVRDMDTLPYPDFDDYFARLQASPLAGQIDPVLYFETSRGCWWGEKHHCKFCGLNGRTLAFRSKSPERALAELRYLVDRYGVRRVSTSDNILDRRYFKTFLPMLREARRGGMPSRSVGMSPHVHGDEDDAMLPKAMPPHAMPRGAMPSVALEYELKTNLSRRDVRLLVEAGLHAAQLGIETFLTPVLKLAGKGATALQNLQTLRWFSEAGVEVKWNLLYGFPGEEPADYAMLAELLPSLVHLAPPQAIGRVRLDRFSPYFEEPARYGIANPRPNRAFRYVYPFDDESLARLAYYFEYDYTDGRNVLDYAAPAIAAAEAWRQIGPTAALSYSDGPDSVLLIHDTRPCAAALQHRLAGLDRRIYLYGDRGPSLNEIMGFVAKRTARGAGVPQPDEDAIRHLLDEWLAARLMVFLDGRYLSLAICSARYHSAES